MSDELLGELVQRLRGQRLWTQQDVADEYNAVEGRDAMTGKEIGRYEREQRIPSRYTCRHLATVFGVPSELVERAAAVSRRHRREASRRAGPREQERNLAFEPPSMPTLFEGCVHDGMPGSRAENALSLHPDDPALRYPASVLSALETVTGLAEDDVLRRELMGQLPFLLTALHEPTRNWLLAVLELPSPSSEGRRVSKARIEQIRTVINTFAEADAQQGGGHGRQALAQYLRTTVLPLLRAESNEHVQRALFDLAGEQAQLIGWMSYDTGHHGLAQRYLLQALRFSEEAQNPVLGAHTMATLSHLAGTLGHADEGVQLAKTGQIALRGASNAMYADLAVLEARSYAMQGLSRKAAEAVIRAENALHDVVTENEPPEMRFIDHAYIAGEIANTLILLGDPLRAIDFADQSIDASLSQGRARRGALSNIALARAHLAVRDIDGACLAGGEALRLSGEVDSARTAEALRDLRARMAKFGDVRPVRELVELMEDT
ncbi:transcriptional regulator [Streptomyces gamaensis]|uniref:Transcriptional regulator n=1 Tax=Streptomyces gamaensis TaxID=1763542 RepID=A0ABW0Z0A2_9ACTN